MREAAGGAQAWPCAEREKGVPSVPWGWSGWEMGLDCGPVPFWEEDPAPALPAGVTDGLRRPHSIPVEVGQALQNAQQGGTVLAGGELPTAALFHRGAPKLHARRDLSPGAVTD